MATVQSLKRDEEGYITELRGIWRPRAGASPISWVWTRDEGWWTSTTRDRYQEQLREFFRDIRRIRPREQLDLPGVAWDL